MNRPTPLDLMVSPTSPIGRLGWAFKISSGTWGINSRARGFLEIERIRGNDATLFERPHLQFLGSFRVSQLFTLLAGRFGPPRFELNFGVHNGRATPR